ncbi:hypothetical protein MKW94_015090 [Papaver nudicaule]|uniref:Pectinesterase inhibitor domain-containing protein n=1 Tax=Papaver nudicaule TaxID=74823 RepID=A0AA41VRG9_PAPNU|nr:hypothetical protein [Papaver nudicaule]
MAISSYRNFLISLLVLLFTLSGSTATTDSIYKRHIDVTKVCSLVKDKDYCSDILVDYAGIYGLDVKDVGTIFINEAMYRAKDAINKLMDLIPKARGDLKSNLTHCNQFYMSFLQTDKGNLSELLGKQDYIGLNREAVILAKHAIHCEESFKSVPSPLTLYNSAFFNSIDMISAFSYLLIHQ